MANNRIACQNFILKYIDKLTYNKENVDFYSRKFKEMSDSEFASFVDDLRNERVRLSIIEPNLSKDGFVSSEEINKICTELGYDTMQAIYIEGKAGMPTYKSTVKYPVYILPVRRASQMLIKKVSVPPHTKVRDLLTGQVTGESKGAALSGPENQMLGAMGANYSAIEKMKYTGGDARGEAAYIAMLSRYGRANQAVLEQFSSGVQAISAVNTFLTAGMHRVNL